VDGRDVADAAAESFSRGAGRDVLITGATHSRTRRSRYLSREVGQRIRYVDIGEDDACVPSTGPARS
jgi:hypothetical protein